MYFLPLYFSWLTLLKNWLLESKTKTKTKQTACRLAFFFISFDFAHYFLNGNGPILVPKTQCQAINSNYVITILKLG